MRIEFETGCKFFRDIPCSSVFLWNENNKAYVKIDSSAAIDLDEQTAEGFDAEDEVIPCTISKIILRKK